MEPLPSQKMQLNFYRRPAIIMVTSVILASLLTSGGTYAVVHIKNEKAKKDLQDQLTILRAQVAAQPMTTPTPTAVATISPITPNIPTVSTAPLISWKTYISTSQEISFQYPSDYFVTEDAAGDRISLANHQTMYDKSNRPENAEDFWISSISSDSAQLEENLTKSGKPSCCLVRGAVTSGTINNGLLSINTYSYTTVGGDKLEAYWKNPSGKNFFATNATEVGSTAQSSEVNTLYKLLSTILFK